MWGLIVSEAVQMDLLDRRDIEEEKEQNTPIPTGPHCFFVFFFCFTSNFYFKFKIIIILK